MLRSVPTIETPAGFDAELSSYLQRGNRLALMLDYDGTLAPITDHPSNTYMLPRTAAVLGRLAANAHVHLAIISGRGRADVQRRVGLANTTYSGNHGLEIRTPDGVDWLYAIEAPLRSNFERLVAVLDDRMTRSGAWVENKRVSLTYHYREAPVEQWPQLHAEARNIVEQLGFVACDAHGAIEAKPPVQWNKGDAAERILAQRFGVGWREVGDLRVVFVGDDRTDEDAMRALQAGERARTFRVAERSDVQTYADYRLVGPGMVTELLEWIKRVL